MPTATKKTQPAGPLPNMVEPEINVEELIAETPEAVIEDEVERAAEDLEAIARQVFGDDIREAALDAPPAPDRWTPKAAQMWKDDSGGLYLPVRRRVIWMRGEPEPHPDWTIETQIVNLDMGTYQGTKMITMRGRQQKVSDVKGGFAVVEARIFDAAGRLVACDVAHERSESFFDFIEKASTAAVGRALALCGYGTEVALDLDEGYEAGNIADAPVAGPGVPAAAINIEASSVEGVRQGGRQTKATQAQLAAVRDHARRLTLGPSALQRVIVNTLPQRDDPIWTDGIEDNPDGVNQVLGFLSELSFEECGTIVQVLEAAAP